MWYNDNIWVKDTWEFFAIVLQIFINFKLFPNKFKKKNHFLWEAFQGLTSKLG